MQDHVKEIVDSSWIGVDVTCLNVGSPFGIWVILLLFQLDRSGFFSCKLVVNDDENSGFTYVRRDFETVYKPTEFETLVLVTKHLNEGTL